MVYQYKIKEMPEDLRPRERLVAYGVEAMDNAELLAIILGSGSQKESALSLAYRVLKENDGLQHVQGMSLEELQNIHGIGLAKAVQIKAALELGKRVMLLKNCKNIVIKSPQSAANILMEDMKFLDREYFKIVLLNTKNHLLSLETISIGSLNASIVHPREVFKLAIKKSAASIILAHNHPSGDTNPSEEDIGITKRLIEAGKIIGIDVLDHLIIGDGYSSLRERGIF